ncbi:MAG: TetR family transcriptional regulator [Amycolatopsis sp.]|nr:TetR family transcriptional regulator [Amycolatopsis sp.]
MNSRRVESPAAEVHDGTVTTDSAQGPPPGKRRGRRPAGQDTRTALVEAARTVFGESGYEGATVRTIAARAGVDAAMVNHWFGGKEGLFAEAVLELPFEPSEVLKILLDGSIDELGERIVRTFLTRWDMTGGGLFQALIRSITAHEQAGQVLRDFFLNQLFQRIVDSAGVENTDLRATLCASQLMGLGMTRYVAKFEPLASADVETLVKAVAPTIQRYINGDIG